MRPLFLVFLMKCLSKFPSCTVFFSGVCWDIQLYSVLTRHIHAHWDIIKAYSGMFRHIEHPVQPSHIHNFAIFWAQAYLELEVYLKHCETLIRHIQNPFIGHYSAEFRDIQNLVQHLDIHKPGILEVLENSELFHNYILTHIQNIHIRIFRTLSYLRKFENIQNSWHI